MTNPLSKSSLQAAIATSVALAVLLVVQQPASAQHRYGKTPPATGMSKPGLFSFGKKAVRAVAPKPVVSNRNNATTAIKAAAAARAKSAASIDQVYDAPLVKLPSNKATAAIKAAAASRSDAVINKVQYNSPVVELPSASYEGSVVVPPASEVVVPAIEGVVPSYEVPLMESPGEVVYPEYPSQGEVIGQGEIIVEQPYQQGMQYQQTVDEPAPIYSTGSWYRNGDFYFEADMVWLKRETPDSEPFVEDVFLPVVTSINDDRYRLKQLVNLGYAPGTRLTFGRFLGRDAGNRDYSLDFSYLGGFNWDKEATLVSREGNGLNSLFPNVTFNQLPQESVVRAFFGNDAHTIQYESDLNSFELNYRIRTRPGRDQLAMQPDGRWVRHGVTSQMRSLLAGLRFISLTDTQTVTGTAAGSVTSTTTTRINNDPSVTVASDEITDLIRGTYAVDTTNSMIGFQVGGELTEKYDEWTWGLRGKVGGLLNFAGRNNLVNSLLREAEVGDTVSVPAVDADGNAVFQLVDNVTGLTTFVIDNPDTPDINEAAGLDRAMDSVVTTTQTAVNVQASGADDSEQMTFLAELGLFGTYQIRPNFHFRAAYDFILLAGVGVAGDNASLQNGFGGFNSNGSAFFHGGSFGFETSW